MKEKSSKLSVQRKSHENKKVKPVRPVLLKNIYQSNTYSKEAGWLHLQDEPRLQQRQQVKDQQSYITGSIVNLK